MEKLSIYGDTGRIANVVVFRYPSLKEIGFGIQTLEGEEHAIVLVSFEPSEGEFTIKVLDADGAALKPDGGGLSGAFDSTFTIPSP